MSGRRGPWSRARALAAMLSVLAGLMVLASPARAEHTASVHNPLPGEVVRGRSVSLQGGSGAECYLLSEEFYVDGLLIPARYEEEGYPYWVWDSTTVANGEHTATYIATDDCGDGEHQASAARRFLVNNAPPVVAFTTPAAASTVGGAAVPVRVSASPASGSNAMVRNVEYTVDGAPIGRSAVSPYTISWDTRGLRYGMHTLRATATDSTGLVGTSQIGVHVDNRGPSVGFAAPASESMVSDIETVSVYADASQVEEVALSVDGQPVGHSSTAPYTFQWDTWRHQNGPVTLEAVATGTNGLTSSTTRTVTVLNDAINAVLTAPSDQQVLHGRTFTLRATSDAACPTALFYVDGELLPKRQGDSELTRRWDPTTVADGEHEATVVVSEECDDLPDDSRASSTFLVSNVAPEVDLLVPVAGSTVSGSGVRLRAAAQADPASAATIQKMAFAIDGVPVGQSTVSPFTVLWDSRAVAAGTHIVRATATDSAGITGSTETTFRVDNAPPHVSVGPAPSFTLSGTPQFFYSATDTGSGVSTYDVRWRRARYDSAFEGYVIHRSSTTATSSSVPASRGYTYCLSARARDALGNTSNWSGERCIARALDDRSLAPSSAWTRGTGADYYRDTITSTRRDAATLSRADVQARRVALVATRCPGCGSLAAYWNGQLVGRVSLNAAATAHEQILPIADLGSTRSGTLVLKTRGTAPVRVDGLALNQR